MASVTAAKLPLVLALILLVLAPPSGIAARHLLGLQDVVTELLPDGVLAILGGALIKIHPVRDGSSPPQQVNSSIPITDALPGVGATSNNNGIQYHGGPIMKGNVNTYVIFYGNWSGNTAPGIVTGFLSKIGGTPYFGINKLYTDATGTGPSNQVAYKGSTFPGYTYNTSITDAQTQQLVMNAIQSKALPQDTAGVYFVVTSADVAQSISSTASLCNQYCGYHSSFTYGLSSIKYALIGNTDRCPQACSGYPGNAPNGNAGADGMVSIIAHELEETVTDELANAWYDTAGNENADKCAYKYGVTYLTTTGQYANVNFGGTNYLIQQNWKPAGGGYCALS